MVLAWSKDLALGLEVMDKDHHELFDLLARFETAGEDEVVGLFAEVVDHLTAHFERENQLMRQHNFFAYPCHHDEHEMVLAQVRALLGAARAGNSVCVREYIAHEIGPWFFNHRDSMDFVTAEFLKPRLADKSA